jgi:hypothetical protein
MATVEHEQPIPRGPSRPRDHHVFVSAGGRRQSALRAAGLVAGALALVWLVALGLALAGSTRIPGLPVPDAKPADARDGSAGSTANAARRARAHVNPVRTATPRRHEPRRAEAAVTTAGVPTPARSSTPMTRVAPAVAPTLAIQTAATPTQGWLRRGWTDPPGQTKRSEPTARGAGRRTDAGTTSTTHGNGHGKG